jgi:cytochrome c-type biogenesis protein CcmH/NrfG
MKLESLVFAVAAAFFGLLVGWMIGSQHGGERRSPAPPPVASQAPAQPAAPPLDQARLGELRAAAERNPADAAVRAALGNLYFDAERFEEAIRWYEEALKLDPRNPDVSTDLGVSYYYVDRPDHALRQFDHSLGLDPAHAKTMFNMGIVRAFGKQDLDGAAAAWQRLLEVAPDTPEGRAARQALDNLKAAHPGLGSGG